MARRIAEPPRQFALPAETDRSMRPPRIPPALIPASWLEIKVTPPVSVTGHRRGVTHAGPTAGSDLPVMSETRVDRPGDKRQFALLPPTGVPKGPIDEAAAPSYSVLHLPRDWRKKWTRRRGQTSSKTKNVYSDASLETERDMHPLLSGCKLGGIRYGSNWRKTGNANS